MEIEIKCDAKKRLDNKLNTRHDHWKVEILRFKTRHREDMKKERRYRIGAKERLNAQLEAESEELSAQQEHDLDDLETLYEANLDLKEKHEADLNEHREALNREAKAWETWLLQRLRDKEIYWQLIVANYRILSKRLYDRLKLIETSLVVPSYHISWHDAKQLYTNIFNLWDDVFEDEGWKKEGLRASPCLR